MKKLFFIPVLLLFVGCASYTYHHAIIQGSGTYMVGGVPVQGNIVDDSWSCVGIDNCPSINEEVVNAVKNSGSALNTAK